jgi:hypothetical protein
MWTLTIQGRSTPDAPGLKELDIKPRDTDEVIRLIEQRA